MRSRSPRDGVAVVRENGFTPVRHVLDLISESHPELAPLISKIWEHTANVEMRLNARLGDETAIENVNRQVSEQQDEIDMIHQQFGDLREDLARRFTDLTGQNGTNGKVGTIRTSLEKLHSRLWWGVTFIVGAIGGAGVKLVLIGKTYGEMEAEIKASQAQIQLLQSVVFKQSQSAPTPGKVP